MLQTDVDATYVARLEERRVVLGSHERVHRRLGQVSLVLALTAIGVLIVGGAWMGPWLVALGAVFIGIMIVHTRVLNARDRARSAVGFYERGRARIHHEWIGRGETGDRFRPAHHLYADDLDLFGHGGLFELLATARTQSGEETLAAIRRSSATGLPYGSVSWVERLAKKLNLDLTIRPRGRPRKRPDQSNDGK